MVLLLSLRNSSSQSKMPTSSLLKRTFEKMRGPRSGSRPSLLASIDTSSSSSETVNTVSSGQPQPDVMNFLIALCPEDVLPKILAFAGPQKTAALSKVNRVWRDVIAEDRTWRVLCEDLYKVCSYLHCLFQYSKNRNSIQKQNLSETRASRAYRTNSCCSSLAHPIRCVTFLFRQWTPEQATPVSWKHFYRKNPVVPTDYPSIHAALTELSNGSEKKLRQDEKVRILVRPGLYDMPEAVTVHATRRTIQVTIEGMTYLPETFTGSNKASLEFSDRNLRRVTLVSKTRLRNEPLFRVIRGRLVLKNLSLQHMSSGCGVGSGNSAILVQPSDAEESILRLPRSMPKAAAVVKSVEVVSKSGRGVVALDGGCLLIKDSYIHNCAATGVYVGGHACRVHLEAVDVTENGDGNHLIGGIRRGHSGMCIEQGVVSLSDCNVSLNSASGISIVSPDLTELTLKKTDLLTNFGRPINLQMGNMDQIAIDKDCKLAFFGSGDDDWSNPRSGILVAERDDEESEAQSPDL
jgi:hypothetical protein